ncbi:universal stress protein [Aromatoleum diolicum]|uniref:Universal stress protein n=1 Tax=Aromatoleum diolicum TaxID=75796 RepID=A0ABX1Q8G5_9RHOO|nr:universal stress protein [Aromatoleum diolicum]NMG74659.1 universal stress protein [Aromatoleum diolicum]
MYKNILLPTDGSELSLTAIRHGIALAKAVGAKVTGLSVVLPSHAPTGAGVAMLGDRVLEDAAEEFLAVITREANDQGVQVDCFYVSGSSPFEEIIAAAEGRGCDLICMASHARSGLAGLLLGSETTSLLNNCRIPVLVLR